MVSNSGHESSAFGSGRLLDDLIRYVYQGRNCRLLMVGDRAQLPPVGETESPALSADILGAYGLKVHECDLNEVVRQGSRSGILYNATNIRRLISGYASSSPALSDGVSSLLEQIKVDVSFRDVAVVPGDELIEQLGSSYGTAGLDDTIVITRSNKRANIYNQGIRNTILDREEALSTATSLWWSATNISILSLRLPFPSLPTAIAG